MGATAALAQHVATCPLDRYPSQVVAQAKELIFDFFGVAVAGARTETGRLAAAVEGRLSAPGRAAVIGHPLRLAAPGAAYINAVSAHSLELDDVDPLALLHVHPVVVSAVLAVAEEAGAGGRDLLAGVLAGWEVVIRISNAANPSLRDRGFHSTPTCGVFGAAAGAARVLGLSAEQTASALGLASAHGVGLMEMYGPSMQKRINP
ncbi:MAG TPA: MmgE/PrpD family protein, partial [Limnochordales bacterium]